ncbi:MAG: gliding motility-associated C-terminal domain-containing protein [Bacteroidota bacterium]
MKKRFLIAINAACLLIGFIFPSYLAQAGHIAGGELELTHVTGDEYRVGMTMYFDAANGDPLAIDNSVTVYIYDKTTDERIREVILPLLRDEPIQYSQLRCAVGDLITRRIYYAVNINLPASEYNNPEGYYIVWPRCCRNNVIDNILAPGGTTSIFYLEFPPVTRGGERFLNSSPRLFPAIRDYACAGQTFAYDFSGIDSDGDQLIYSLSAPLTRDGSDGPSYPPPYESVTFVSGIGVNNMIPGNLPLSIDANTGVLTLEARTPGLYIFGVTIEEYRNGVKIGEVRRDKQLLVLDCPPASPPAVTFTLDGEISPYQEGEVIRLESGRELCGTLEVSDPDDETLIRGAINPLNFEDLNEILDSRGRFGGSINDSSQTFSQDLCFLACPNPSQSTYGLQLIVEDNTCSVPLFDTLNILVEVDLRENVSPEISSPDLQSVSDSECRQVEAFVGETLTFDIIGEDSDNDFITLNALGLSSEMSFPSGLKGESPLTGTFSWSPDCEEIPDGQDSVLRSVEFLVADSSLCFEPQIDTLCVDMIVRKLSTDNFSPELSATISQNTDVIYTDSVFVGETFNFDVISSDQEGDSISVELIGINNAPVAIGVNFTNNTGNAPLISNFRWATECGDLDDPNQAKVYQFQAIATDFDLCGEIQGSDTITIDLVVIPREKSAPEVTTNFPFDSGAFCDTIRLTQTVTFDVFADDAEGDSLELSGQGVGFNLEELGMEFSGVSGFPQLQSNFRWETSCEQFDVIDFGRAYEIDFIAQDFTFCPDNSQADTVRIKIVVLPPDELSEPPTVSVNLPVLPLGGEELYSDTLFVEELFTFTVTGNDPERDSVRLEGAGLGYNFEDLGMNFPATQTGSSPLTGEFSWQPPCDLISADSDTTLFMDFIVTEIGTCGDLQADTIRVALTLILNPENNPPIISTSLSDFDVTTNTYSLEVNAGDTVFFDVIGSDPDENQIFISGESESLPSNDLGVEFTDVDGLAPQQSTFRWITTCELLGSEAERTFDFFFSINDIAESCQDDLYEQVRVRITVIDNPDDPNFEPYNVFTPNGDGFNDTFTLPFRSSSCNNQFEHIIIFNRWGREVFFDEREDFSWDGEGFPDGVYFYKVTYQKSEFEGSVSLIRGER